jgi:ubiquinone/menaquinone biosynthesis C-methylase UbiE
VRRRYHAFSESQYWLPNDDIEISRLDIQHHIWRLSFSGHLHISPLSPTATDVLDIGTGTGQWAIEFADAHPDINVLGTDLSPIQPGQAPPNCTFIVDNAEDEWVYDRKFDFVHARMLLMGVHDWPRFLRQAWDNLKPGGWIEFSNPNFPICRARRQKCRVAETQANGHPGQEPEEEEDALILWSQRVREAAAKDGIDTLISAQHARMLEEAGFTNIRVEPLKWAVGAWPKGEREKNIGRWTMVNTKSFVEPIALALFTKRLGWTREQAQELVDRAMACLDDRKRCYYWQL